MHDEMPLSVTKEVYGRCLCLGMHRAARTLARRFDEALKPFGLSHGQYSLLMSLNRPQPPRLGETAALLSMDRTTLTANLKPLERRGLVVSVADSRDRRSRRLVITDAGIDVLKAAVPVWRATHDEIDAHVPNDAQALRRTLDSLAAELQARAFASK